MKNIFLILIVFVSCNKNMNKNHDMQSTIEGTTLNFKVGAKLSADSGGMYLIDNLSAWDKEFVNKKVEVTGRVIKKKRVIKANANKIAVQTDYSTKKDTTIIELVIVNAKWKLLEIQNKPK